MDSVTPTRGIILIQKERKKPNIRLHMFQHYKVSEIIIVSSEESCIRILIMVIYFYNPDVLWTYENDKYGLAYVTRRSELLKIKFGELISKSPNFMHPEIQKSFPNFDYVYFEILNDDFEEFVQFHRQTQNQECLKSKPKKNLSASSAINGRIVFDLREIFQDEFKLKNYKLSTVSYEIIQKTLIEFSKDQLMGFVKNGSVSIVVEHLLERLDISERIIAKVDYWNMISEFSLLYGITLRSISRGLFKKNTI